MGWAVVKQDICDNQRFPVAVFDWGVQNVTIMSIYKVDEINWLRRRGMFPVNTFTEATAAVWIQLLLETRELKCGGRRTGLWSPRANSLLDSTPTSQYYCTPEKKGWDSSDFCIWVHCFQLSWKSLSPKAPSTKSISSFSRNLQEVQGIML